ncbi:MAG: HAMP domain-containing histidine kinase [Sedimentisphaerales bacterium]|nr:HAMP domain-containing histidine kinase [Sedimentisphaerales bacterium]
MYKRLVILSLVVVAAVCGLGGLGYHAVAKWAQGLEGARLGEFAEVAEQIRQDVKRKLDDFIQAEQQRKYTDYLYYYVPEEVAQQTQQRQQLPVLRSPLGSRWSNGLAYGYFQIEADGSIAMPYSPNQQSQKGTSEATPVDVQHQVRNIEDNVLPSIRRRPGELRLPDRQRTQAEMTDPSLTSQGEGGDYATPDSNAIPQAKGARSKNYPIESLQKETQEPLTITQQRLFINSNEALTAPPSSPPSVAVPEEPVPQQAEVLPAAPVLQDGRDLADRADIQADAQQARDLSEMVQIRIEPFMPLVVPGVDPGASIFGGQVFLLRHVQIEDRHLLQGFQLDEHRLIAEVEESARRQMRDGMGFALPQVPTGNGPADDGEKPAYTAILDFGFGNLALSLTELDPAWIVKRAKELHRIYFGILVIVVAAVALALVSLWHNVRAQVILARKKDDFVSAVSHELRTPLTSIRMYSEMLEKNWVKSQEKRVQYYQNMRQESERLSRLVENVLDFARLQKGRKRYRFELGDLNDCIGKVVEMMRPYAQQHGFTIRTEFGNVGQITFDQDAIAQIAVNLIDNAVKYAGPASDKIVIVRTRTEATFAIIEVEDHGPGIPHRQQTKVFDPFYRCDDTPVGADPRVCRPPQRQPQGVVPATGTGLGLTLVKRFAEAHGGRAEVCPAEPTGTIFRVSLTTNLPVGH